MKTFETPPERCPFCDSIALMRSKGGDRVLYSCRTEVLLVGGRMSEERMKDGADRAKECALRELQETKKQLAAQATNGGNAQSQELEDILVWMGWKDRESLSEFEGRFTEEWGELRRAYDREQEILERFSIPKKLSFAEFIERTCADEKLSRETLEKMLRDDRALRKKFGAREGESTHTFVQRLYTEANSPLAEEMVSLEEDNSRLIQDAAKAHTDAQRLEDELKIAQATIDALIQGNKTIRKQFGARENEEMFHFVQRLHEGYTAYERDDTKFLFDVGKEMSELLQEYDKLEGETLREWIARLHAGYRGEKEKDSTDDTVHLKRITVHTTAYKEEVLYIPADLPDCRAFVHERSKEGLPVCCSTAKEGQNCVYFGGLIGDTQVLCDQTPRKEKENTRTLRVHRSDDADEDTLFAPTCPSKPAGGRCAEPRGVECTYFRGAATSPTESSWTTAECACPTEEVKQPRSITIPTAYLDGVGGAKELRASPLTACPDGTRSFCMRGEDKCPHLGPWEKDAEGRATCHYHEDLDEVRGRG